MWSGPTLTSEGGTSTHILGADKVGRDVLSRIIHGSRVSMKISLVGIGIGGFIGVSLGLISGYFRGWLDHVIMRLVDISLSIPAILLALALAAALGPSFRTIIIVVAVLLWAVYARQVRGDTLAMRERDFIARARVSGVFPLSYHRQAHTPECHQHPYCARHATGGIGYPLGGLPQLPRGRAQPSHACMGIDGSRWPGTDSHGLVGSFFPRSGHYADGAFFELVWGLAARSSGSQAAATLAGRSSLTTTTADRLPVGHRSKQGIVFLGQTQNVAGNRLLQA